MPTQPLKAVEATPVQIQPPVSARQPGAPLQASDAVIVGTPTAVAPKIPPPPVKALELKASDAKATNSIIQTDPYRTQENSGSSSNLWSQPATSVAGQQKKAPVSIWDKPTGH